MISCTDFIPAYNELFAFIDDKYGFSEVQSYWDDIFDPSKDGLLNRHMSEKGLAGCFDYWKQSLNEEAADFRMMLNEKDGWFTIEMRRCPSKGRLLDVKHIKPYDKYCLHCDLYRITVESYGLKYDYDFTSSDKAACVLFIYDPKIYKGRRIITPDTVIMDRKANDNVYHHQEFHYYLNMSLDYVSEKWGEEALVEYLNRFAENYYAPLIARIKAEGLAPLAEEITAMYKKEMASELLYISMTESTLKVAVDSCPVAAYLKQRGVTPSKRLYMTTSIVMNRIAELSGLSFTMNSYNTDNGAAEYTFASK